MFKKEIVNIDLQRKDIYFLINALNDYSGIFKENSDTRKRIEKIIKELERQEEEQ